MGCAGGLWGDSPGDGGCRGGSPPAPEGPPPLPGRSLSRPRRDPAASPLSRHAAALPCPRRHRPRAVGKGCAGCSPSPYAAPAAATTPWRATETRSRATRTCWAPGQTLTCALSLSRRFRLVHPPPPTPARSARFTPPPPPLPLLTPPARLRQPQHHEQVERQRCDWQPGAQRSRGRGVPGAHGACARTTSLAPPTPTRSSARPTRLPPTPRARAGGGVAGSSRGILSVSPAPPTLSDLRRRKSIVHGASNVLTASSKETIRGNFNVLNSSKCGRLCACAPPLLQAPAFSFPLL